MKNLILKLEKENKLTKVEWMQLIEGRTPELAEFLFERAREVRHHHYGKDVYIRGLIEFSNYCKNDCCYCGFLVLCYLFCKYNISYTPYQIHCHSGICT